MLLGHVIRQYNINVLDAILENVNRKPRVVSYLALRVIARNMMTILNLIGEENEEMGRHNTRYVQDNNSST